ncbi:RRXRR domain-containing protein [Acidithiobacillus sp.]|uniref:RRXRR domain-containing protein n=1 Tax=Acidithiobacillus sp. TaxID=1872118 RepID=UPI003D04AB56
MDRRKKPLMPCSVTRARLLLERGLARVHRMVPFTIRLVDRRVEDSMLQPARVAVAPVSKSTGMALVWDAETVDGTTGEVVRAVLW